MPTRFRRIVAFAFLLTGCGPGGWKTSGQERALGRIDHVIVGVADLDAGIKEFERMTGARPEIGGVHPGRGTRNALLSLGDGTYLELYAPDPAQMGNSPDVAELKSLHGLKPLGWAVFPQDPDAIRAAMKRRGLSLSSPEAGSRRRPDGQMLEWETLEYKGFDHPLAPFFIRWRNLAQHPSRTTRGGCRLVSLRLVDPQAAALANAIQPLRLGISVDRGPESRMEVKLICVRGEVLLR